MMKEKKIHLVGVNTADQHENDRTKPLNRKAFERHIGVLMAY